MYRPAVLLPLLRMPVCMRPLLLDPWPGDEVLRSMVRAGAIQVPAWRLAK
jgi:hypothetical protein